MSEAGAFGVMTSGASTAALLSLLPVIEQLTGRPVVLLSRSVGVGDTYIPNRLKRGEVADVVIVADDLLRQCMVDGLVVTGSRVPLVHSLVGMAVRAGAARPRRCWFSQGYRLFGCSRSAQTMTLSPGFQSKAAATMLRPSEMFLV